MEKFIITTAQSTDFAQIREVFRQTILHINIRDYSHEQVKIWSSVADNDDRWTEWFDNQYFLIAKKDIQIVGYGSMTPLGYLDSLYVRHKHQGQGIGRALIQALLSYAKTLNVSTVQSDVSITARPLFEKMGFKVIREQQKPFGGLFFTNYIVENRLTEEK